MCYKILIQILMWSAEDDHRIHCEKGNFSQAISTFSHNDPTFLDAETSKVLIRKIIDILQCCEIVIILYLCYPFPSCRCLLNHLLQTTFENILFSFPFFCLDVFKCVFSIQERKMPEFYKKSCISIRGYYLIKFGMSPILT